MLASRPLIAAALLLFLLLLLLPIAASSKVLYVKTSGIDSSAGTSWAAAKKTIAAAVTTAASGDEIWVAGGPAYLERITLKSGLSLYGGFNGTESNRTARNPTVNPTILDGSGTGAVVYAVGVTSATVVDGFTLRNGTFGVYSNGGNLTLSSNVVSGNTGLGVYVTGGAPTISGNRIEGNSSGMDCFNKTTAVLTSNVIRGNKSWGVRCNNSAVTFTGNAIRENSGPGILCQSGASILARRNLIAYNRAGRDAGGIQLAGGTPTVEQNVILGNTADDRGGGLYSNNSKATIRSNVFAWNTSRDGGGLYVDSLAQVSVINNTFAFNAATVRTAGGAIAIGLGSPATPPTLTFANNVIAHNTSGIDKLTGAKANVSLVRNCVWDNAAYTYQGLTAGATDLLADPRLASTAAGDYHLAAGSSCINQGDAGQAVGSKDLDDEARVAGVKVDIGADEYVAGRALTGHRRRLCVKPAVAGGSDAADGTSWAKAKATPEGAAAIALPGDTVWVAKGTYIDGDFFLPPGVAVLGGFAGNEVSPSQRNPAVNPAILVTGAGGWGVRAETVGATAELNGLTIRGTGSYGLYVTFAAPTISQCIVENGAGTGIYLVHSSPFILNCQVRKNNSVGIYSSGTGALVGPVISGCAIRENKGGEIYLSEAGIVEGCQIELNTSGSNGAGVSIYAGAPTVQSCTIRSNTVTATGGEGGGVYILGSNARLISNVIARNTSDRAAGVRIKSSTNPLITNNTIVSNTPKSATEAGGIEIENNSSPAIANNIIAFNVGHGVLKTGATGTPQPAANCLFGNTGSAYANMSGGAGDIAADPQLRNPGAGDYHLKPTSPCANLGSDLYIMADSRDIDGQARRYGARVDMGADELRPFGMVDFNDDGKWDAVANNPSTGAISVLLMNGAAIVSSYSLSPSLPAGWLVGGTGDFFGDSTTSLAVQNLSTQQISILGVSGKQITRSVPLTPSMLPNWKIRCTGDFNGDGRPDLVAQNTSTRDISILLIGNLKIQASVSVKPTLPAGWQVMGAADFDGNGTSDILVQNGSTQQVSVLYMAGTTLSSSASLTPNLAPGWSVVGVTDVYLDGRPGVLVQNGTTRQVSVLLVSGTKFAGSLAVNPTLPAGWTLAGPR